MARQFKLPELGENVEKGDVLNVLVSEGDTVEKEQAVLELETEKATVEVPIPFAGKVTKINVSQGDTVKVGDSVLEVEEAGAAEEKEEPEAPPEKAEEEKEAEAQAKKEEKKKAPEKEAKDREEPTKRKAEAEEKERAEAAPQAGPQPERVVEFERRAPRAAPAEAAPGGLAPAAPHVRREARELGIDISQVPGSGPGGRISSEDVKNYVRALVARTQTMRPAAPGGAPAAEPLPDFSRWGPIERQPMSAVRRKTAQHLSYAWASIPHVTQHDKADVTALEELRERYGKKAEKQGAKLTVTAILLKILAGAVKVFPQFATSVDMEREELIYKKYCHVGVAVDTDRGLLVPVIRDVDKKNILELAQELTQAAQRARERKLTMEEMQGATITVTNLGGLGGTAFTPVVNSPEVAILGVSRSSYEPVLRDAAFVPRLMLPLSLSYDHRVIDGADAARFLRWVAEALEQPFLLSLEG